MFSLRKTKHSLLAISAALFMATNTASADTVSKDAVLETYSNIAHAIFEDSVTTAKALEASIHALIANPSSATLNAAKAAWITARMPYQQSEAYRFGNPIVDDWEGRVNAWPLDEGLIDYVDQSYGTEADSNQLYTMNVIANKILSVNGKTVDASLITPQFLAETLHEAEDVEANVATGYHAIEFLLWGQDTNGTGAGAGARPATDFDLENCTGGNCERRIQYLTSATTLLINDLKEMQANWSENGVARAHLLKNNDAGIATIFTGMGSLSYGELAGERMKLGLLLGDPEEEHDCFSDNTHNSHYFDQVGIRNVYTGHYKRIDGRVVSGASVADLVEAQDATVNADLLAKLDQTVSAMARLKSRAESIEAYDQMIGEGNAAGNAVVQAAIDGLIDQTRSIERAVSTLGLKAIEIEGSDSLDKPSSVFQ
ncbi:imelysin family protein [Sneathiella sp.]|jgi:putative iron-regulated protein|uniref:imelysin family protein n=1 Tax=Sneathiella sp. TaxID=1964365 RepID=UPI0039E689B3